MADAMINRGNCLGDLCDLPGAMGDSGSRGPAIQSTETSSRCIEQMHNLSQPAAPAVRHAIMRSRA